MLNLVENTNYAVLLVTLTRLQTIIKGTLYVCMYVCTYVCMYVCMYNIKV